MLKECVEVIAKGSEGFEQCNIGPWSYKYYSIKWKNININL